MADQTPSVRLVQPGGLRGSHACLVYGILQTKPLREDTRIQLLDDSTHSGGRWRKSCSAGSLVVPWEAVAGPSRAAHPSDSCGKGLIEIAAEFKRLEVVSAVPAESIGFSPDGRLPQIASLIRAAAWDERCAGTEERLVSQCSLTWKDSPAGSQPSKSVELRPLIGRAVRVPRYWRCMPRLEGRAPQRCTRLAFCVGPVQGPVASVFQTSHFAQSHRILKYFLPYLSTLPKYLQSWRQFWASPEALAHWRRSSEWIRMWQQRRRNTPRLSLAADQKRKGLQQPGNNVHVQRVPRTRRDCPGIITATHGKSVRKDLMALLRESTDHITTWFVVVGTPELCLESSRWAQDFSARSRTRTSLTTTSTTTCRSRIAPQ